MPIEVTISYEEQLQISALPFRDSLQLILLIHQVVLRQISENFER